MEHQTESPMDVVENATAVLTRISSICALMRNVSDREFIIQAKDVAQVMMFFHLCLDEQIRALDGIQWREEQEAF